MYPDINDIEQASHRQLAWWYRFLPSPRNDEQTNILDKIVERFKACGGMTPEISKSIGWENK